MNICMLEFSTLIFTKGSSWLINVYWNEQAIPQYMSYPKYQNKKDQAVNEQIAMLHIWWMKYTSKI